VYDEESAYDDDPLYGELEGADDEDPVYDVDDPVYDELEGTEGGAEAGGAAAAGGEAGAAAEGTAGDAAGEAVVALVGVNDGRRLRGVKTDSRSGLGSSALAAGFGVLSVPAGLAVEAFLGFPILSAGSGGTRLGICSSLALPPALLPALPLPLPAAEAADAAAAEEAAAEEAAEFPLSSARDGDPMRDGAPAADPECEPSARVRDDDMMPLSTTESSDSASGSASRTGGAIMNGIRDVGPASSTPSSSVLTSPLRTFA
jgi:hypothetical protein